MRGYTTLILLVRHIIIIRFCDHWCWGIFMLVCERLRGVKRSLWDVYITIFYGIHDLDQISWVIRWRFILRSFLADHRQDLSTWDTLTKLFIPLRNSTTLIKIYIYIDINWLLRCIWGEIVTPRWVIFLSLKHFTDQWIYSLLIHAIEFAI